MKKELKEKNKHQNESKEEKKEQNKIEEEVKMSTADIVLKVFEARNLKICDLNGSADPYMLIKVLDSNGTERYKEKTAVILKNLNPKFDATKRIPEKVLLNADILQIEVWDWDKITNDDFMGQISWKISQLTKSEVQGWYPLQDRKKKRKKKRKKSFRGEIRVHITQQQDDTQKKHHKTPQHCEGSQRMKEEKKGQKKEEEKEKLKKELEEKNKHQNESKEEKKEQNKIQEEVKMHCKSSTPIYPKEFFVINTFYMRMRNKYTKPNRFIYYYEIEWDSQKISWKKFRSKVIGSADPTLAAKASIRYEVFTSYEEFGLRSIPNKDDNIIHASASQFEGLCERMIWLQRKLSEDKFGKALLGAGIPEDTINKWFLNPKLNHKKKKLLYFNI